MTIAAAVYMNTVLLVVQVGWTGDSLALLLLLCLLQAQMRRLDRARDEMVGRID